MKFYNQTQVAQNLGVSTRTITNYVKEMTLAERKTFLGQRSKINELGVDHIRNAIIMKNPHMRESFEKKDLNQLEVNELEDELKEAKLEVQRLREELQEKEDSLHKLQDSSRMHLEKVHERYLVQIENMNQTHQRDQAIIMSLTETVKTTNLLLENKSTKKGWFSRFVRKD